MRKTSWIVAALVAGVAACSAGKDEIKGPAAAAPAQAAPVEAAAKPETRPAGGPIEITVTEEGFQPDKIAVKKGEPVTFGFTRKTDKTCAKEVVIQVSPTEKIEKPLPLGQRVEVTATFPESGEVRYACGMNMVSGVISVH